MVNVGPRVKYFRQRFGLSQMDLELETSMAFGSVSRLESGENKPTRATLERIGQVFKLSDLELDYLYGSITEPATEEEIKQARECVKEYFAKKGVIAYLCDERYRLLDYSDTFAKFLGLSKENETELAPKIIGKTVLELLINQDNGLKHFFDDDNANFNIRIHLRSYYQDIGFMVDDPSFQRTLKAIMNDPLAKQIWTDLSEHQDATPFHTIDERKLYFKVNGIKICLQETCQELYKYRRFIITDFIPTNKVLRYLAKIL